MQQANVPTVGKGSLSTLLPNYVNPSVPLVKIITSPPMLVKISAQFSRYSIKILEHVTIAHKAMPITKEMIPVQKFAQETRHLTLRNNIVFAQSVMKSRIEHVSPLSAHNHSPSLIKH